MNRVIFVESSFCGPCALVKPNIEKLIKEGYPIERLDALHNEEKCAELKVSSVPTLIMFDDSGVEIKRYCGAMNEVNLRKWLTPTT